MALTPREQKHFLLLPTILLSALSIFQLALMFGAPLGRAAWGGMHEVLPLNLRIGSAFSLLIYYLVLWIYRARLARPESRPLQMACGLITIYFGLGVFLNLASSSIWEKTIWAPVALALAWSGWRIFRFRGTSDSLAKNAAVSNTMAQSE